MRLFSQKRINVAYSLVATLGTITGALSMPIVTSTFADGTVSGAETEVVLNLRPVLGLWLSSTTQQGNTTDFTECSYYDSTTGLTTPVSRSTSGACPGTITSSSTQARAVTFDVIPGSSTAATADMSARVMTNANNGYKLYIEMASGSSQSLSKTGESRQIGPSAGTIAGGGLANLAENTWGVKGGDVTNWIGVPANGSRAGGSDAGLLKTGKAKGTNPETYGPTTSQAAPAGSETTTITFGARVDSTFPSGAYTSTVLITAVAVE